MPRLPIHENSGGADGAPGLVDFCDGPILRSDPCPGCGESFPASAWTLVIEADPSDACILRAHLVCPACRQHLTIEDASGYIVGVNPRR